MKKENQEIADYSSKTYIVECPKCQFQNIIEESNIRQNFNLTCEHYREQISENEFIFEKEQE